MSTKTWIIPAGNAHVEAAREAFTKALIGVSINILIRPDDIDLIGDEMLRRSARAVYDEAGGVNPKLPGKEGK
jgi:hypothetical protein